MSRPKCVGAPLAWFTEPDLFDRGLDVCRNCPMSGGCLSDAYVEGDWTTVRGSLTPEGRMEFAVRYGITAHGTWRGYQTNGCRCDVCRAFFSGYHSDRYYAGKDAA